MTVPTVSSGPHHILRKILPITLAILGIAFILWLDSWFTAYVNLSQFNEHLSVGLLVLIGFLTGFHCVGMCGPLILSYATKNARAGYQSHVAHLLYGVGKTVSYTTIGALLGAFGAVVAFTPYTRRSRHSGRGVFDPVWLAYAGSVSVVESFPVQDAGVCNAFFWQGIPQPLKPLCDRFAKWLDDYLRSTTSYVCDGRRYRQLAGGWEDSIFFGIGTLPLLLGFGFLTSLLSNNLTPKLLKVSGAFIILGVIMLNRGVALTTVGVDFHTLVVRVSQQLFPLVEQSPSMATIQTITMEVSVTGYSPNQFTLHKGIPVKWGINAKELTECNKIIVVPQYGLEIKLQPGVQVIEFTPNESGEVLVLWSCWMGMIHGTFLIPENPQLSKENQPHDLPASRLRKTLSSACFES